MSEADKRGDEAPKPGAEEPGTGTAGDGAAYEPRARLAALLDELVPKLALIVAVIATAVSGFVLWQYREFYVALDDADATLVASLEEARAGQRRLTDEVETLRAGLAASRAESGRLARDLEVLPAEIRALGRRIDALQGGRLDVRETWLRAEAEYYLGLANTELNLAGRWDQAIEALELADDVLRTLGDPGLSNVRAAIAEEVQRLRAVEQPDLERIALDLSGLIERVPELPMRADSPEAFAADAEALDEVEPGLGRLWQRLKGAVTSVVRVERRDEPVDQVLTEAERQVARRQLALELQLARVAAVQGRAGDFRGSLERADAIVFRDFNRAAASVSEARRLLGAMMRIELAPPRPDISDSLTLLRAAPGAE
jgi:uroporphyrin-3 C-methyltransferase